MWGQTQHGPISIRTWHAWAAFHQKSAGVYPGSDWKHCVCQLVIWLIVPVVGGKSWQPSSDTCTSQGQTSWSGEALRIWWVYLVSWRLQRHVEMVFHAHPMSAHDTDLGRGSHCSMWRNPLGPGEHAVRNSLVVCLIPSAVSTHPIAGMHWEALKSSQNLEPEVVSVK